MASTFHKPQWVLLMAAVMLAFALTPGHAGTTCKPSFSFLAPGSDGSGRCPDGFPDKHADADPPMCYAYCPDGTEGGGQDGELCVSPCPAGYNPMNSTHCEPYGGVCPSGFEYKKGTCIGPCPSGLQGTGSASCITPCTGGSSPSPDGRSCVRNGARTPRTVTQRPTQPAQKIVARASQKRPSAKPTCGGGFTVIGSACVLGCPSIGGYKTDFDEASGEVTCKTTECPDGGQLCGSWCMSRGDAAALSSMCGAVSRLLDNVGCDGVSGCSCHLDKVPADDPFWSNLSGDNYYYDDNKDGRRRSSRRRAAEVRRAAVAKLRLR